MPKKKKRKDGTEKPRVLIPSQKTPWEIKKDLEWDLEQLAEEHPELFIEERENALWNQFNLRLFETLLSEFSKTDKYKNLQKDIAKPLLAWMKIVSKTALEGFGSDRETKIIHLLAMASKFKLKHLSKVKEYVKNKKPLYDLSILIEYELVLKRVQLICKKRYHNPNAKFLDLKDKLKNLNYPEEKMRKIVSKKPSTITCELLASKYNKSPSTIRDLVIETRKEVKLTKEIFDLT